MNQLVAILANPFLYTLSLSFAAALYLVWTQAKQQYLGINQQFNLLVISVLGFLAGFGLSQAITRLINQPYDEIKWFRLMQPIEAYSLLAGYAVLFGLCWLYINRIRYPWWRVMDINAIGLSVLAIGWALGSLIAQPDIEQTVVFIGLMAVALLQVAALFKSGRPGVATGVQLIGVYVIYLGLLFMPTAWQDRVGAIEYLCAGLGLLAGIIVTVGCWLTTKQRAAVIEMPRGASESFVRTFQHLRLPVKPSKPSQKGG